MCNTQKPENIKNSLKIYEHVRNLDMLQFSSHAVSLAKSILQWDADDTEIVPSVENSHTCFTHCQQCLPF